MLQRVKLYYLNCPQAQRFGKNCKPSEQADDQLVK